MTEVVADDISKHQIIWTNHPIGIIVGAAFLRGPKIVDTCYAIACIIDESTEDRGDDFVFSGTGADFVSDLCIACIDKGS